MDLCLFMNLLTRGASDYRGNSNPDWNSSKSSITILVKHTLYTLLANGLLSISVLESIATCVY